MRTQPRLLPSLLSVEVGTADYPAVDPARLILIPQRTLKHDDDQRRLTSEPLRLMAWHVNECQSGLKVGRSCSNENSLMGFESVATLEGCPFMR